MLGKTVQLIVKYDSSGNIIDQNIMRKGIDSERLFILLHNGHLIYV